MGQAVEPAGPGHPDAHEELAEVASGQSEGPAVGDDTPTEVAADAVAASDQMSLEEGGDDIAELGGLGNGSGLASLGPEDGGSRQVTSRGPSLPWVAWGDPRTFLGRPPRLDDAGRVVYVLPQHQYGLHTHDTGRGLARTHSQYMHQYATPYWSSQAGDAKRATGCLLHAARPPCTTCPWSSWVVRRLRAAYGLLGLPSVSTCAP